MLFLKRNLKERKGFGDTCKVKAGLGLGVYFNRHSKRTWMELEDIPRLKDTRKCSNYNGLNYLDRKPDPYPLHMAVLSSNQQLNCYRESKYQYKDGVQKYTSKGLKD